jgi:RNA polymerase sigma-70 factor (ECF subfamily)
VLNARELQLQALSLRGLGRCGGVPRFSGGSGVACAWLLQRRLARRPSEVEDLVQEVLLAVHNARHTYQAQQPLTAWVQAIARYKLADHLRSFARHEARNDPLDDDTDLFAGTGAEPAEASLDLERLLEQLPARQRLPIVHVKLRGCRWRKQHASPVSPVRRSRWAYIEG